MQDVQLLEGKFKRINTDNSIKDKAEFILAGYEISKKKIYTTAKDLELRTNNYIEEPIHGVYDTMATIFKATGSCKILPTTNLVEYIDYYDLTDVVLIPLVKSS